MAQRRYSLIIHHAAWLDLWNELNSSSVPRRELVRFVACSQRNAGAFLNAIPMRAGFRFPSWAMRVAVQRRLGLIIDEALASPEPTLSARGGRVQDPLGDAACNIAHAGCSERHHHVVAALVRIMQSVWGNLVEKEPQDHFGYSNDYRPDITAKWIGADRKRLIGDVKVKDPLSSNAADVDRRGGCVGFGNTEPGTSADVFGLAERGVKADGNFRPGDGGGHVAYARPDYAHALSRDDTDVQMLLFETFGGWSTPVVRLFHRMKDKVLNRLSRAQYDQEATWSTRTWLALQTQRMSIAVHFAAAYQIARELDLAGPEDAAAVLGGEDADA